MIKGNHDSKMMRKKLIVLTFLNFEDVPSSSAPAQAWCRWQQIHHICNYKIHINKIIFIFGGKIDLQPLKPFKKHNHNVPSFTQEHISAFSHI